MSKHKKTREQKITSDYRHQVYILENRNTTLNNPTITIPANESSYFNTHILKDISKTAILTLTIVAAQIILFFLLKRHILSIPNLNY